MVSPAFKLIMAALVQKDVVKIINIKIFIIVFTCFLVVLYSKNTQNSWALRLELELGQKRSVTVSFVHQIIIVKDFVDKIHGFIASGISVSQF